MRCDPLVEHRQRLGRFCTAFSDELASLPDEHEVIVGGIVEDLKRRTTRSKDPMAVLKVLDIRNSLECVLFPRAFTQFSEMVVEGAVPTTGIRAVGAGGALAEVVRQAGGEEAGESPPALAAITW